MIPPLNEHGLLPPGVHDADLDEVPRLFCVNQHRWRLWDNALQGIDLVCDLVQKQPITLLPTLILAGSFFSDKALPGDIEATLTLPANAPPEACWYWAVQHRLFHAMLKAQHDLDFYPSFPGGNDFSLFFQYVGPKTAQTKGLCAKDLRGVLRMCSW